VRPHSTLRVALALPVASVRSIIAATQLAIFLVRDLGRIELDLSERGARPAPPEARPDASTILFAAVTIERPSGDAGETARLERQIRERVERYYARQGIVPVYYDLQVLTPR
jgi:hypothetical protein